MPTSTFNGQEIVYDIVGSGPPLIFIHPLPFDRHIWLYQQAGFSEHFTVISMDLRGWGASTKPTHPFLLEDIGRDVMGILNDEDLNGDAVIIGCSIGSKIALMLACDHPETFRAAVLIGGNCGPQNQFSHRIAGYKEHQEKGILRSYHYDHLRYGVTQQWADSTLGRYLLTGFADRGCELDAFSIERVFEAISVSDLTPKLVDYLTPTLIINGEFDNALPAGKKTSELIKNSEHFIIPRTGHCCFIEDPNSFDSRVLEFLNSIGTLGS